MFDRNLMPVTPQNPRKEHGTSEYDLGICDRSGDDDESNQRESEYLMKGLRAVNRQEVTCKKCLNGSGSEPLLAARNSNRRRTVLLICSRNSG
jgi:hypothetical protein